ncbi:MAG: DUF1080 domain-containing protein [Planctomycetes bacterium]|nr:DUF1080 domain-containing protein [Planctomycetota bacterium]
MADDKVGKAPIGFTPLFNGKDLSGWHGQKTMSPAKWAALAKEERAKQLEEFEKDAKQHWRAENGELVNDGNGVYLTSDKEFGDMELLIDYKMLPKADSGVYLRATPQVQIWDPAARDRNAVGSGGLFNNKIHPSKPLAVADNAPGEWNSYRILQVGSRTSVWLNGKLVVNHTIMENYWDRARPLVSKGPIQLQTHGGEIRWRNVFVREIKPEEANRILAKHENKGFESVFNGKDLTGWEGPIQNYDVKDGAIVCKKGKGGTIFTKDEYGDFVVRLEFKLPDGGNNGLAIRYPGSGNTAYAGMCELQVLDSESDRFRDKLDARQYHGSAYGMVPAHRGYLRPTGEWNFQEVTVQGSTVKVELNGYEILNTDLAKVTEYLDKRPHPGKDRKSGHFGFAGHSDPVQFRNVTIKKLGAE